ncbi:hypothetical protein B0H13DRAFT_1935553 [Mycena leptocephala]|nr:hypothetical protein B0H13DRAFT_1935553 [Mycena leptocephala]
MFPTQLSGLLQGCNSPLLHRLIKSVNILNETQLGLDGQAFHDGDLGNESLDMFAQYRDTPFIGVWIGAPPVRYGAPRTSYTIDKMQEFVDYIVSGCQTDPATNARVQYVLEHDRAKQHCAGLQSQVAGNPDAHMLSMAQAEGSGRPRHPDTCMLRRDEHPTPEGTPITTGLIHHQAAQGWVLIPPALDMAVPDTRITDGSGFTLRPYGSPSNYVVRIADAGGWWDEYETRQSLDRKDYVEEGDDGNNAPETHDSQR